MQLGSGIAVAVAAAALIQPLAPELPYATGEAIKKKIKTTEIIPSFFSNHNGMKLEINYKRKNWKIHKHVQIKQHVPEQPMSKRRNQKGNLIRS